MPLVRLFAGLIIGSCLMYLVGWLMDKFSSQDDRMWDDRGLNYILEGFIFITCLIVGFYLVFP